MARVAVLAAGILALLAASQFAAGQASNVATDNAAPLVQPAIDGVFEIFQTHALVGLGDDHGLEQEMDFYAALVSDPRFARDVGNVVVEFGTARHQSVVDRYLSGSAVPYTELRAVWTDTIGWIPPAGFLGFARFLASVRETNRLLPPERHIKVWLGEPPIDWSAPTRTELMNAMSSRDSHPADLIDRSIVTKGKKALIIYGHVHFGGGGFLGGRIRARHPDSLFALLPYSTIHKPAACAPQLEQAAEFWPVPVMAAPRQRVTPDKEWIQCATFSGTIFDGLLFLGPVESLTRGAYLPDYVLDRQLRLEMSRRSQIGGAPLVRFPAGLSLRKSDYDIDLGTPDFTDLVNRMFSTYDLNSDGVVTATEYVDPVQ